MWQKAINALYWNVGSFLLISENIKYNVSAKRYSTHVLQCAFLLRQENVSLPSALY